jgi:hypothetical protein
MLPEAIKSIGNPVPSAKRRKRIHALIRVTPLDEYYSVIFY